MTPLPTRLTKALLLTAGAMGMVGVLLQAYALVVLSVAPWLLVTISFAFTVPAGRRLRRQKLEFAWWLDHGSGAASGSAVAGASFAVRCLVRHRGHHPLHLDRLEPIASPTLRFVDGGPCRLHAQSRSEFTFEARSLSAGRVVLHGLIVHVRGPLGLFVTPLYFPNPLAIRVLPAAAALRLRSPNASRGGMMRPGRSGRLRQGGGTDLHELRDFVPGDPFKSIAWKASARRGRMIVREVEQEVQESRYLIVDCSASMRGAAPGERKLDHAFNFVASECRRFLQSGDRVGLMAFDGRLVEQVPAREGHGQILRIYDALLAELEVVDADRTALDEEQLRDRVAAYVLQQDGIDFRREGKVLEERLLQHIRKRVGHQGAAIVADSAASRALRMYCREVGLPLPSRTEPSRTKAAALVEALKRAGSRSQEPSTLMVVTDFDGIVLAEGTSGAGGALRDAIRLVRAHGHTLEFILPDARPLVAEAFAHQESGVQTIYTRAEGRRLREARRFLGRLGVTAQLYPLRPKRTSEAA